MDSQFRKVQITINNPHEKNLSHEAIIEILSRFCVVYWCLCDEISESGTYHTHIYIVFRSSMRFSTLKKHFPLAHIESAYGTSEDNRNYLLKSGKFENTKKAETSVEGTFKEFGEIPSPQREAHPLMMDVRTEIEAGLSTAEIIRAHPKLSFKSKDIDTLRQVIIGEKYMNENRNVETMYIYGPTGCGKTSGVYKEHSVQDICRVTSYQNEKALFDRYQGQSVLVFEEFRGQIPLPDLLSYLDIYPLMLPARYSDKVACYTKVYLLSNVPLWDLYQAEQRAENESWQALLRRIHIVRAYSEKGCYADYKMEEGGFWKCM